MAADLESADLHQTSAGLYQESADLQQKSAGLYQESADLNQKPADLYQESADLHQKSAGPLLKNVFNNASASLNVESSFSSAHFKEKIDKTAAGSGSISTESMEPLVSDTGIRCLVYPVMSAERSCLSTMPVILPTAAAGQTNTFLEV